MNSKNAFFTYTNIPADRLTLVKKPEGVPQYGDPESWDSDMFV